MKKFTLDYSIEKIKEIIETNVDNIGFKTETILCDLKDYDLNKGVYLGIYDNELTWVVYEFYDDFDVEVQDNLDMFDLLDFNDESDLQKQANEILDNYE